MLGGVLKPYEDGMPGDPEAHLIDDVAAIEPFRADRADIANSD